jgi:DoxX-like family
VAQVMEGTAKVGYPAGAVRPIGIILLVCLICYVIPRTSVLGAILLTGYLGGAVATNVRISAPLFSYILTPVYVGLLVWGGLFLRDERLRELIPLRQGTDS